MVTHRVGVSLGVVVLLSAASASAQISSGPQAGAAIEALPVYAVTGDHGGGEVNYAMERKDKPTLYVFIQAEYWDRPVARFLKTLDQKLADDHTEVQLIAVWLTDDVEKSKQYLPIAQNSLQLRQTALTVYTGDKSGPEGWAINTDAYVTAVVAKDGKVDASFGHRSVNETVVPEVLQRFTPK
jgi:hypothetical protein